MFDNIQIGRRRIGLEPLPNTFGLMADAAEAINNGFEMAFGDDFKRGVCWFHVKQAVDKRLKSIQNLVYRGEIISDIIALHVLKFYKRTCIINFSLCNYNFKITSCVKLLKFLQMLKIFSC